MFKSKLTIILFAIVLLILPILTLVLPKKEFSENENRMLTKIPKLTLSSYLNKSFMKEFESYISDHFLARESWIIVKNSSDTLMGKSEINGVITIDNQMLEVNKTINQDQLMGNIKFINYFVQNAENTYVLIAPTAQGIYRDDLPKNADFLDQKQLIKQIYDQLKAKPINVYPVLAEHKDQYIYYRTDHHWTSYGAFLAYGEYCKALGLNAIQETNFKKSKVSDDFRGTLYSKTLDSSVKPDTITIYEQGVAEVTVTPYTQGSRNSLYYPEYLEEKDKYSVFLGSNKGLIQIDTNCYNNESLLIIKDSYANSFLPFLVNHYQHISVLDLRYANKIILEQIDLQQYKQVLYLFNAITFTENNGFALLRYID